MTAEQIKERLAQNLRDRESLEEEGRRLQKQLEKKPLRHGDYGFDSTGGMRLFLQDYLTMQGFYACEDSCWATLEAESTLGKLDEPGARILGNIFDDLAKIKESRAGF